MLPVDPVVLREIPVIQKIVQDETWLEGERRGCSVSPADRVVREKVCEVILRIGQQLRESLSETTGNAADQAPDSVTNTSQPPG